MKKMKKYRRILSICMAMALIVAAMLTGCSKDSDAKTADTGDAESWSLDLTLAAPHTPPQNYALCDEAYIEHMKEVSGGKINFTYYPGGSLIGGREAVTELAAGTADMGWPRYGYSQYGYKVNNASLTWMYNLDPINDVEAELEIFGEILKQEPFASEFEGIVPYGKNAGGTSAFFFSNKPIEKLTDIKGKTIRANAAWAKVVTALGGVPVNIPMSELYLALEKGTVDGTFGLPAEVLSSQNFGEVVDYGMDIMINQSPYVAYAFNEKSWNSMPVDAQEMFKEEEPWLEREIVDKIVSQIEPSIEFGKEHGMKFIDISDEDKQLLFNIMDKVIREDCAVLDKDGYKATEMYELTQSLIKDYLASK